MTALFQMYSHMQLSFQDLCRKKKKSEGGKEERRGSSAMHNTNQATLYSLYPFVGNFGMSVIPFTLCGNLYELDMLLNW